MSFTDAYNRLLWARENRPSPEKVEELRKREQEDAYRAKRARFKASIA